MSRIPLSVPNIKGKEWEYIKDCLDTEWVSSSGSYVDKFESEIAKYTGAEYAVACVNGTAALQVALRLSGVENGDEVLVPTLTFIAPINAVKYNNGSPIFFDADSFYNVDTKKIIQFLNEETEFKNGFTFNKKTKKRIIAFLPVHVWGNACWLDDIIPLCEERNITVVEDASESLGTFYKSGVFSGKHTGTVGKIGCISFNGNKIITAGGGGMIITNDKSLAAEARYLTTQAKDDSKRYIHNNIGYNFRLTNIQAALGLAQLEQLSEFVNKKSYVFQKYKNAINETEGLNICDAPDYSINNHWMILLQIGPEYKDNREKIMSRLESLGIQTRPPWAPIHLQNPYKECQRFRLEKAEKLINLSLCIPSSTGISNEQISTVIDALQK